MFRPATLSCFAFIMLLLGQVAPLAPRPSVAKASRPLARGLQAPAVALAAPDNTVVTESFKNSTPDNSGWVLGGSAYLTSNQDEPVLDNDPAGQGWLRFNRPYEQYAVGSAYYDQPLAATQPLTVSFDYACWGGAAFSSYPQGADGLSFFLFDGASSGFTPGGSGGSLGYTGMPNAYLGVGLDEWGNFSDGNGGPGSAPNSVAVRGSAASSWFMGATPAAAPTPLCDINAFSRPSPGNTGSQHIVITLTPVASSMLVTVQRQSTADGPVQTIIDHYDVGQISGQGSRPATIKFGFAGAVGTGSDAHEISNLSVTTAAAISTPTATPTPPSTPITTTGVGTQYDVSAVQNAALVSGTVDTGNHCDDCSTQVTLPFSYTLYDQSFGSAYVTSNGQLDFTAPPDESGSNDTLPDTAATDAIFAHWGDLRTDTNQLDDSPSGVYTTVSGAAPNRMFTIEWRATSYAIGTPVNFEIRLYEGSTQFDLVYGTVDQGGASATVGVQQGSGDSYTQFESNTVNSLAAGLGLHFALNADTPPGPPPLPTPTGVGTQYDITPTQGMTVSPGVDDTGNHCDDCSTQVTLPFSYTLYGQQAGSAYVISNGQLDFTGPPDESFDGSSGLPDTAATDAIFAHWGDLRTDGTQADGSPSGIYTTLSGQAPNQIFTIEWRANYYDTGEPLDFAIRLYENTTRFDVIYNSVQEGGASATVGVQEASGTSYTQLENYAGGLTDGLGLTFTLSSAPPRQATQPLSPTSTEQPAVAPNRASAQIAKASTTPSPIAGTDLTNLDSDTAQYIQGTNGRTHLRLYNAPVGIPDLNSAWRLRGTDLQADAPSATGLATAAHLPFGLRFARRNNDRGLASLTNESGVTLGVGLSLGRDSAPVLVPGRIHGNAVTYSDVSVATITPTIPIVAPPATATPTSTATATPTPTALGVPTILTTNTPTAVAGTPTVTMNSTVPSPSATAITPTTTATATNSPSSTRIPAITPTSVISASATRITSTGTATLTSTPSPPVTTTAPVTSAAAATTSASSPVAANSDLTLRPSFSGLDARLAIHDAKIRKPFVLALTLDPRTRAVQDADGTIRVTRAMTDYVGRDATPYVTDVTEYVVQRPVATDSSADPLAPVHPGATSMLLMDAASSHPKIALTVDPSWLRDRGRVFPVNLDIPVTTGDAATHTDLFGTVNSCKPNVPAMQTGIAVGRDLRCTDHGLLRFDLSSVASDMPIISATLRLYTPAYTRGTAVQVYQNIPPSNPVAMNPSWRPPTWRGAPAVLPGAQGIRQGSGDGHWQTWDVTSLVRSWVHDPASNGGMTLATDGVPALFASSLGAANSDPATAPSLDVTYAAAPAANPSFNEGASSIYGVSGAFTADPSCQGQNPAGACIPNYGGTMDVSTIAQAPDDGSNGGVGGSYMRFSVRLSCANAAPGRNWWNGGDANHVKAYDLLKAAYAAHLIPIVLLEADNNCNGTGRFQTNPGVWQQEAGNFIDQMPVTNGWPRHLPMTYFEIANEVNFAPAQFASRYKTIFAQASVGLKKALKRRDGRVAAADASKFRATTSGMLYPQTTGYTGACLAKDKNSSGAFNLHYAVDAVGLAESSAYGLGSGNLAVAVHPYTYATQAGQGYWRNYYAPHNGQQNHWPEQCRDLKGMINLWRGTSTLSQLPLVFTEDNWSAAAGGVSKDCSDTTYCEGAYLVDLFTWLDQNHYNDPSTSPLRIAWYRGSDPQGATIPIGLYDRIGQEKRVNIAICGENPTHVRGTHNIDNDFY